jgi:RecA/RadA recombinase
LLLIGIHGVAGSGKSTLAQYICASENKVKEEKKDGHFHLVIWIHLSQKFDLDAIFRDMIEGATGEACPQFNSHNALVEKLKKALREKRILLVLDDVWYNIQNAKQRAELKELLSPLKVGMTGRKVLVTSRTKDALIALGAVEERRRVEISELSEEVFLEMFRRYAFQGVSVADHDRIKTGKDWCRDCQKSDQIAPGRHNSGFTAVPKTECPVLDKH